MQSELQEHWRNLLKPLFPASAYIKIRKSKGLVIGVDWRLRSYQQEKFSRLIKIIVSQEQLETYLNFNSTQRAIVDERLIKYIQEKLQNFNPEHDTPRGRIPPQEEWTLENKIFEIKLTQAKTK